MLNLEINYFKVGSDKMEKLSLYHSNTVFNQNVAPLTPAAK